MKFTATDGTIFSNRSEYRKYEMETQYTFRNKESEKLYKDLGQVQGQPFNIVNCNKCIIVIPDYCDQVQIDDTSKSKIFIGASSESIFVRDCSNCTFTIACKQFRARDCTNCTFYLYCKTEPVIETSKEMKFGSFNGAYPGHEDDMKAAGLMHSQEENNLWHAVYDFNDDKTEKKNWSLMKNDERGELWCPLGPAKSCLVSQDGGTSNTIDTDDLFEVKLLPTHKDEDKSRVGSIKFDQRGEASSAGAATLNNPTGRLGLLALFSQFFGDLKAKALATFELVSSYTTNLFWKKGGTSEIQSSRLGLSNTQYDLGGSKLPVVPE